MRVTRNLLMTVQTYKDALAALNSLQSNHATITAIRMKNDKRNPMALLDMKEWCRRIGYNEDDLNRLNMIHITGTKGKGSTAAFTSNILYQYNDNLKKIGLYTSPHLKTVRERIRINGLPISEELFTKYFFQVWNKLDSTQSNLSEFPHLTNGVKPAYFKFLTLLSFHVFLMENCNCCVYEVGIGGELDSTNVVNKPLSCGVSLIGIDHTAILGNTIEEITWNKSGIFKPGSSAFSVENQLPSAKKVLQDRANERKTDLTYIPDYNNLKKIKLGISGDFQISNASLAVALASSSLNKLNIHNDIISLNDPTTKLPSKFIRGLQDTTWNGRCQTLIQGNKTWYLDGAHTKDSMIAASTWLRDTMKNNNNTPNSKRILLFNQQTRDANALIDHLYDVIKSDIHFDEVIFSTNVTWKSGYSDDLLSLNNSSTIIDKLEVQKALAEHWKTLIKIDTKTTQKTKIHVTHSIQEACDIVDEISQETPVSIFATGSLHLVGGLLVVLEDNKDTN